MCVEQNGTFWDAGKKILAAAQSLWHGGLSLRCRLCGEVPCRRGGLQQFATICNTKQKMFWSEAAEPSTGGSDFSDRGHVPVVFDYGEDVAALNLLAGAQCSIAIYTDRVHALSLVRKIILRMKSWESFVI